jgi:hypothetical protein
LQHIAAAQLEYNVKIQLCIPLKERDMSLIMHRIFVLERLIKALFTSPVFSPPKNVEICGNLVFTQYSQIPTNTLLQK